MNWESKDKKTKDIKDSSGEGLSPRHKRFAEWAAPKLKGEYTPATDASQSGNHFTIFFLLIPIGGMIWALRSKAVLPIDHVDFLMKSVPYIILSFSALWFLSYFNVKRDKKLIGVSAFFLFLWLITGIIIVGKINTAFDESAEKTYYIKATEIRKISGGGTGKNRSSPSCLVTLEKKTLNVDVMSVKYEECDLIRPNIDGLLIKAKDGYLGMPWMTDHSIVKDYDLYKSRLGITDGLNQ